MVSRGRRFPSTAGGTGTCPVRLRAPLLQQSKRPSADLACRGPEQSDPQALGGCTPENRKRQFAFRPCSLFATGNLLAGGSSGFDVFSRLRPVYFLQRPNEVLIINEGDQQLRHVYLNVPHSKSPKPSWYGESVGHYDNGDLVIDTIGLNDKTYIDNYLTPHTTALHVVERFHPDNTGTSLALTITVDDPGAFNTEWTARQVYYRRPQPKMEEAVCAENNADFFGQGFLPIPEAKTPDF